MKKVYEQLFNDFMSEKSIDKIHLQLFNDYLTNYGVSLEIDTTPDSTSTWVVLGDGFDNIAEALNEVVNQYQYLNKEGYGESEVTGMQPVWTLTGVRKRQDDAQNYIFSKKYELLDERKTNLRIQYTTGTGDTATITFNNVTMANIQEFSGNSTDGAAISVEFHTSEKPVSSGADLIGTLSVVSVAGTTSGDTQIYVNPELDGTNIYKYQLASSIDDLIVPAYDEDVSSLTTWNGTDEITSATGTAIMIVEATSGELARKAGKQSVTAL